MERKKLKRQNLLQLLITLVIIVLVAYVSSFVGARFDLTSEKRYTLSDATKEMLKNLDDVVYVEVYLEGDDLPVGFNRLKQAVKENLDEFKVYAGDQLEYKFINPSANPDEEIRLEKQRELAQQGINPIQLQERTREGKTSQKTVFPGALIYYKGKQPMAVNFLKSQPNLSPENNLNNSIQALEYELTNAVMKLIAEERQKIAFLEGHGELQNIELQRIATTLEEYYDVSRERLDSTTTGLENYSVLIVAKPRRPFSEAEKYVLDQYFMRGGKLLFFVDGTTASMDSLHRSPSTIAISNELNLSDMLFKYGIRLNPDVVMDLQSGMIALTVPGTTSETGIKRFPWPYNPLIITQNNHPITKYMNMLRTEFVSSLDTVGASPEMKKTVLLTTSEYSLIQAVPLQISFDIVNEVWDERRFPHPPQIVAAMVEGRFQSLFKNRHIAGLTATPSDFVENSVPTKIIVAADGDIIRNTISSSGETYPLGFDRTAQHIFQGNTEFTLNAVNYLCEDDALMSLRLRELKLRLLDKDQITNSRLKWQLINTILPILVIVIMGFAINSARKNRYTK